MDKQVMARPRARNVRGEWVIYCERAAAIDPEFSAAYMEWRRLRTAVIRAERKLEADAKSMIAKTRPVEYQKAIASMLATSRIRHA